MAWNGTDFLVVWEDYRSGSDDDIFAARVSGAGTVLDPAGIPISTAANIQHDAGGGLERHRLPGGVAGLPLGPPTHDIYGARVSGAGSVLDPAGIPISTAANGQHAPAVAWNGTNFLVVWQDARSGHLRHLRGAGQQRGQRARPRGHPHLHRGQRPDRAGGGLNGTNFLVVWQDRRSGTAPTSTAPG